MPPPDIPTSPKAATAPDDTGASSVAERQQPRPSDASLMNVARVVEILIAPSPTLPVQPQPSARAVPGLGLVGDRYHEGRGTFSPTPRRPDFEITLIQIEHVEAFAASTGIAFTARDARRNLVTRGIDLNALVGREFQVGSVTLRGLRLCEPCQYLARQTHPEVLRGLVHKGGLRAQILTAGELHVGDEIVIGHSLPPGSSCNVSPPPPATPERPGPTP